MIPRKTVSIKKICLWGLIAVCGILALGFGMISVSSIWTGFSHIQHDGSWLPIMGGTLLFFAAFYFYARTIKRIRSYLKDDDVFLS